MSLAELRSILELGGGDLIGNLLHDLFDFRVRVRHDSLRCKENSGTRSSVLLPVTRLGVYAAYKTSIKLTCGSVARALALVAMHPLMAFHRSEMNAHGRIERINIKIV